MKASELMIGDWVKPKNVDLFFRVGLISAVSVWNNSDTHEWDYDEIVGIPLTPEILEKNGFAYNVCKGEVAPEIEGFSLDNHWEGEQFSWNGIYLHFVHELQHALRLCGIEKEIAL